MYELSRVRLYAVGPPGARFADVVLDFRGVGSELVRQGALFSGGPRGPDRRPSPATVLFLENGGGKSVLIKLIFSVMLPGRRQVVGTTNTRVLEKFVTATEVAHVAIEWQHTETGQLRVTGKASGWKGHIVSSDPANLLDRWYSFRPTEALNLDSLPLTHDDRPLTLTGLQDRLAEAGRDEPQLQLGWTKTHAEWTEHLAEIGLDTELFRYQRAMNAGEGEAADVFSFKTDEAFVDFLLKAVMADEDPKGLAEVVDRYAHKIASRGSMLAERDFVAGALDRLAPLAAAERLAVIAREVARTTRTETQEFLSEVSRRHAAEAFRLESMRTHLRELVEAEQQADQEQRRLNAVHLELRRLLTEMRLEKATAHVQELKLELEAATLEHSAWLATDAYLHHRATTDKAKGLRTIVARREDRARPALQARYDAVHALGRALLAVIEDAAARTKSADGQADKLVAEAREVGLNRDAELAEASTQAERATQAKLALEEIRRAVDSAVAEGWLTAGADVEAEYATADSALAVAKEQFDSAIGSLDRLADEQSSAQTEFEDKERALGTAERVAGTAEAAAEAALAVTNALETTPRLLELLGAEFLDLETDAGPLVGYLSDAIKTAEDRAAELTAADQADNRVLEALGVGGLLPDPPDIERALKVLADSGITAWSGWRYLSQKRSDDQDAILHKYPHLVDGVVLNDARHLGQARDLLRAARLMPTSVVAVGSTAALEAPVADPAGLGYIVPPNPAMYDEDAADVERAEIERRVEDRKAEKKAIGAQVSADRELARRLKAWQAEYPTGTVAALVGERDRTAEILRAARVAAQAAKDARDAAREAHHELRRKIPQGRQAFEQARERAERLRKLAEDVARTERLQSRRQDALTAAKEAEERAKAALRGAENLRSRASQLKRQADDHRRTIADCKEDLGRLHGAGTIDESAPVPTEPLQALKDAARHAEEAYAKVEVDSELRTALAQAEDAETSARKAFNALDGEIRRRAEELVRTPDGASPASRDAATTRAAEAIALIDERRETAQLRVGELTNEFKRMAKQERSIDEYGRPRSIEHGEELVARAERDWVAARGRHEAASGASSIAKAKAEELAKVVDGFELLMEPIGTIAAGPPELYPSRFDGTLDQAKNKREQLRADLTEAEKLLEAEEQKVRDAADELASYAGHERFEQAKSPVRRQIVAVKRDDLPSYADKWEEALRPRLRTLTDDLEQIDRHRAAIVQRLHGMVDRAMATLRSAQRLSRLPDGLGDWSGQEFLRIKFTPLDEAQLSARIGEVVDESAEASSRDGGPGKRDGMALLLRGVRAATPKGFQVEMLKPDAVLRTERLRVSEINDVFSGGQQLTAAIVLYCTLAALRANDRGRARQPHSGVLFLDNPIGRASAGYLLDIQLSVAKALGVQLVYTTGLFDAGALSVFPLLIRLRNDADLRAGKKYLSVEGAEKRHLDQLADPDGVARIDAIRLFHRPEVAT